MEVGKKIRNRVKKIIKSKGKKKKEYDKDALYSCCEIILTSYGRYLDHLKTHSTNNYLGLNYKCGICEVYISRKSCLKEHLKQFHKRAYMVIFEGQPVNKPIPEKNLYNSNPIEQVYPSTSTENFDYEMEYDDDEVAKFYDENEIPYFRKDIPSNQNPDLIKKYSNLLTRLRLSTACTQKSLNSISYEVSKFLFEEIFKDTVSDHYKTVLKVSNSTSIQHSRSDSLKLIDKENRCYYFDLRELIEGYVEQPEICEQIYHEHQRKKDKTLLKNINDIRELPNDNKTLKILLYMYIDDYNTKNAFSGGSSAKTKITAVYFCIGNIGYKYQSKREQISLIGIACTSDICELGLNEKESFKLFFEPIFKQFDEYKNNPIILVNGKNQEFVLEVELASLNGDNLALNQCYGITKCFNKTQCCIYCYINSKDIYQSAETRNIRDYDHLFKDFTKTSYFYIVDLFHDLHEGIILNLMNFLLTTFSPEELKQFKKNYKKFKETNKIDLPEIKKQKTVTLSGTGVQKINFFYIFSFVNHVIPYGSSLYKTYITLRKIVNFLMHTEVYIEDLEDYEKQVEKYFELCLVIRHNLTIKAHHLVHFSALIRHLGPLIFNATLRFERAHQVGKGYVRFSKNRKNLALSIANIHRFNKNKIKFDLCEEQLVSKNDIDETLENFKNFFNTNEENYLVLTETEYEDRKIEINQLYIYINYDAYSSFPVFFYVDLIIKNETTSVLGHLLAVEHFDNVKHAYKLKEEKEYQVLDKMLPYHKKLKKIICEDDSKTIEYVCKDFHLKNCFTERYLSD